jgi:regulator of protease activity HflC (stomatin/prohibitin superfamily)
VTDERFGRLIIALVITGAAFMASLFAIAIPVTLVVVKVFGYTGEYVGAAAIGVAIPFASAVAKRTWRRSTPSVQTSTF